MKRLVLILGVLALMLSAVAADAPGTPEQYIKQYSATAVSEMIRSGVPASITLAQGLLESGAGTSSLAVNANNHFGIKCGSLWKGPTTLADDDRKNECFRVYDSAEASFRDHSDFLRYSDRYKFLFDLAEGDYKGWAHGLKKAGYATDPAYPRKLIELIERYGLASYDTLDQGEVLPAAPDEIERPRPLEEGEKMRFSLLREAYSRNGVPFILAAEGESYASIAKAYHLFKGEILRFNDAGKDDTLLPGDIVYLQPKKKKAPKGLDKYIAEGGESLRDVSRRFAVRLSSLCKKNALDAAYVAAPGDEILLR